MARTRDTGPKDTAAGSGDGGARAAALALLTGVLTERRTLAELLSRPRIAGLPPPVRARAQRLTLVTLRNLSRADAVLKPLLRKEPPDPARAILRLATVEMLAEGGAAHGVVNAAVALARRDGDGGALPGLVNAVLRRVAATAPETFAALPPQPLPPWLRRRLIAAWGKPAVQSIEAVQRQPPPVDLTPRDGGASALAGRVGGTALPGGSVRLPAGVQVSDLPGYAEGDFWVQDAGAALAVAVLAPRSGEAILDLCAAPGGKTLQLAAAGATVTALDLSPARMERVAENLARCRLAARMVVADALDWQGEPHDAVLLDAPCSATGTIRRHPELPFIRDGAALAGLVDLQARLIDRALALTRPGGRMVYCTCSLLPAEGEAQVAAALLRHPGLVAEPVAPSLPGLDPAWITAEGALRLRPDLLAAAGGIDGFFIALLRKPA